MNLLCIIMNKTYSSGSSVAPLRLHPNQAYQKHRRFTGIFVNETDFLFRTCGTFGSFDWINMLFVNRKKNIITVDIEESEACTCVKPSVRIIERCKCVDKIARLLKMSSIIEISLRHIQKIRSAFSGSTKMSISICTFLRARPVTSKYFR